MSDPVGNPKCWFSHAKAHFKASAGIIALYRSIRRINRLFDMLVLIYYIIFMMPDIDRYGKNLVRIPSIFLVRSGPTFFTCFEFVLVMS